MLIAFALRLPTVTRLEERNLLGPIYGCLQVHYGSTDTGLRCSADPSPLQVNILCILVTGDDLQVNIGIFYFPPATGCVITQGIAFAGFTMIVC